MNRSLVAAVLLAGLPIASEAQSSQSSQQYSFKFQGDALGRYEWTRDFFAPAGTEIPPNETRYRLQARPRVELGISSLLFGVGGEFNYSEDENTEPPPALLRDNYKSREARLDLAFVSFKPVDWLQIQGGRFEMPFGLTEMIWDKDLRPQGGAITFAKKDKSGNTRFAATGLYAQGSHVFDDEKARMFLGQLHVGGASASLTGSYIEWSKLGEIEPMIRRQNTRLAGLYVNEYKVVDGVVRLTKDGQLHTQLVIDYCWNTAVDRDNRGLWIGVVAGSTETAKAKLEYTYASVGKDATLAAYATDDFFWATGWEGHRGDVGLRVAAKATAHGILQYQRFKDSARLAEQDHWVKRYRAELRVKF